MEGEPNDLLGQEDCAEGVQYSPPLKNWNDISCSEEKHFICELA